jgi:uncharacterized membrane protein
MILQLSYFFISGAAGAFVADILKDNAIELPEKIGGKIILGSIGGLIIGGTAGLIIDGSLLTAFMGGFMGKEIITSLLTKSKPTPLQEDRQKND